MNDLKDNVIMPSSDYKAICDAVREKTGSTELLKSGELSDAIDSINILKTTDFSNFCREGSRLDCLDFIDTSNGTNFYSMFWECRYIESVPTSLNTSNGTNFNNMFYYCDKLKYVPPLDLSNGIDLFAMFQQCYKLERIGPLDTRNADTFAQMFYQCTSLTSVSLLDTSKGTKFNAMFAGCEKLTNISMNPSNGKMFYGMFDGCKSLASVYLSSTSNGESFNQMFRNCESLKTIASIDLNNITSSGKVYEMFYGCVNLTNLTIYNIRVSITIGSGTSWGHLLTVDSLIHTIQELCTVTTSQTITIGSTNLAKIADLYCRVIDDTTEKKPMELCDSTAEGAMTLSAYAALKNWQIA